MKHFKKIRSVFGFFILGIVLCLLGYLGYVYFSYERIEDYQVLSVQGVSTKQMQEETTYRAVTYNVGFGAYSADYSFFMDGGKESRARSPQAVYENIGGAARTVQALSPDLIFIQELDTNGTRSHHINEYEWMTNQFGNEYVNTFARNYHSAYLFWPLLEPHGANESGLATFSRFPIQSALRRQLPVEDSLMKFVDLDRAYTVNRIAVENGKEFVAYHIHLSAYTSDGTIAEQQLEMLFADMMTEVEKGNYVLAAGDFNKDLLGNSDEKFGQTKSEAYTWAQPIPQEMIPEDLELIGVYDEEKKIASCRNADRPYDEENYLVTVDGFIRSDNIEITKQEVIDTKFAFSDHNPVMIEFELKKAA